MSSFDIAPVLYIVVPSSPPAEVRDAIASAARAYDHLWANGWELHFEPGQDAGRVRITVHDTQGRVVAAISPSRALEVASTGNID